MEYNDIFAKQVFELRKARGISQEKLGKAVGLSHKAISTIESGARSTTIEKLIALARYFEVSIDYLLGLKDAEK